MLISLEIVSFPCNIFIVETYKKNNIFASVCLTHTLFVDIFFQLPKTLGSSNMNNIFFPIAFLGNGNIWFKVLFYFFVRTTFTEWNIFAFQIKLTFKSITLTMKKTVFFSSFVLVAGTHSQYLWKCNSLLFLTVYQLYYLKMLFRYLSVETSNCLFCFYNYFVKKETSSYIAPHTSFRVKCHRS